MSRNRKHKHKVIVKLTRQEIMMVEDQWYARLNKAIYRQNNKSIG